MKCMRAEVGSSPPCPCVDQCSLNNNRTASYDLTPLYITRRRFEPRCLSLPDHVSATDRRAVRPVSGPASARQREPELRDILSGETFPVLRWVFFQLVRLASISNGTQEVFRRVEAGSSWMSWSVESVVNKSAHFPYQFHFPASRQEILRSKSSRNRWIVAILSAPLLPLAVSCRVV